MHLKPVFIDLTSQHAWKDVKILFTNENNVPLFWRKYIHRIHVCRKCINTHDELYLNNENQYYQYLQLRKGKCIT